LCPRASPGSSLHLHVLSTPPAFVLSQDQTLRESQAWYQTAPLSDHGKLSSRVSFPRTPAGLLNLTGTDSGPSRHAEAPREGIKPGRDSFESHVLLSFQRPCALRGGASTTQ